MVTSSAGWQSRPGLCGGKAACGSRIRRGVTNSVPNGHSEGVPVAPAVCMAFHVSPISHFQLFLKGLSLHQEHCSATWAAPSAAGRPGLLHLAGGRQPAGSQAPAGWAHGRAPGRLWARAAPEARVASSDNRLSHHGVPDLGAQADAGPGAHGRHLHEAVLDTERPLLGLREDSGPWGTVGQGLVASVVEGVLGGPTPLSGRVSGGRATGRALGCTLAHSPCFRKTFMPSRCR